MTSTAFAVGTPFAPRTESANRYAMWLQWFGYLVADVYTSYEEELDAIRNRVAMNEMSPLQKYRFTGPDAHRFTDRLVTRDLSAMEVGQVMYTPWCDHDGKVVCDGLVFRIGEQDFRISGGRLSRWLEQLAEGFDVEITDETADLAILALQGPAAPDVMDRATGEQWGDFGFSRRRLTTIGGVQVDVARQGFTGELGYELWVGAGDAVALWDAVQEAGQEFGIQPAGEWAIDVARIEAGLLIAGYDYDMSGPDPGQDGLITSPEHQATPYELGMGRFVDLDAGDFVGKQALAALAGTPAKTLVGLELDWRGILAAYAQRGLMPPAELRRVSWYPLPVWDGDRAVGRASSVTWSPTLQTMVGFGHVPPALAATGTSLSVVWSDHAVGEVSVGATVVELPFVRQRRATAIGGV